MPCRSPRIALCALAFCALFTGCAAPRAARARRLAAEMLHPATTPLDRIAARSRLRTLMPEGEQYLADVFFPIGLYDVPESALEEIAAAGFNLVVNGGKDERYLRRAAIVGMKVIPYINTERMGRDVARVKDDPTVCAWYLQDEPDLNEMSPERYRRLARELRALDETRPIYLTVWSPDRYENYVGSCDILAPNPYPIRRVEPEKNRLRRVGLTVDRARAAAGDRPVWAVIQAFSAKPHWPRNPTPAELRAMVFIALNHGADGIIYFSYKSGGRPITRHTDLFAEIKRINGLIRALRAPLLTNPLPPDRLDEELRAELAGAGLDYSVRLFRGAVLFIAVNPDPIPKRISVDLTRLFQDRAPRQIFSDGPDAASAPARDAAAPLTFDPFEVKLFLAH